PAALGRGQPAEQLALAAERLVQVVGADLHRDPARDHRHRRQQRQLPVVELDRLERDRSQADAKEPARQRRLRGQVQVAEQQVVAAQVLEVAPDRLLDLDDQLALLVQRRRVGGDLHPEPGVVLVAEPGEQAGALLDPHLVAALDQVAGRGGHQRHAALVGLGFPRNTDSHRHDLRAAGRVRRRGARGTCLAPGRGTAWPVAPPLAPYTRTARDVPLPVPIAPYAAGPAPPSYTSRNAAVPYRPRV